MIAAHTSVATQHGMSAKDAALLQRIREARQNPRAAQAELAHEIVDRRFANISCHGKLKIRTAEHAAVEVKHQWQSYGRRQEFYFCAFCTCYHLATVRR